MKRLLFIVIAFFLSNAIFSQVPDAFNYQAVIRNSSGDLIKNQSVLIKVSIIDASVSGPIIFREIHTKSTSNLGLVSLQIGQGTFDMELLSSIDWANSPKFIKIEVDAGSGYIDMGTNQLLSVPYALYAKEVENKNDADANPINELQYLSLIGTDLTISNGNTISLNTLLDGVDDADNDPTNELQILTISHDTIYLSNGGSLKLPADQVNDADADPANEIQILTLSNDTIYLSNGGFVKLPPDQINDADSDPTNEIQDLNLSSNILTITNKTSPTQIDLAPFTGTNTDNQVLNLSGTTLYISGGNDVDLVSLINDADSNPVNEIQTLSISNDTISLTNGGFVKLPTDQVNDADTDPLNEIQIISLSNDTIYLSNGGFIKLPADEINDADANPTNEIQNLTLTGDTLKISNGNKVVFPYDSSRWVTNNEKLYYNTGNVGIGTNDPNSKLEIKSSGTGALFQVINANNDTVFAVYSDGVKVFVDPAAKGKVGGFAISGRTPTKAGETVEYFRVTPDSTRIYVNDSISAKGKVGGFAISGRTPTKGGIIDYFTVNKDSTRIYINDSTTSKGKVGGFAISGRTPTKSGTTPNDYFNISGNSQVDTFASSPRILWYPKKEAFLTGRVLVEKPDSVGTNSMATGYESKAIGNYSQAMGFKSVARGNYSMAIGNQALSKELNSFAFGQFAQSRNQESYAFGRGAIAEGFRSFAFGSAGVDSAGTTTGVTYAKGDYSFALGFGSQSTGDGSFAIGIVDTAGGYASFAIGYRSSAIGFGSVAFGYNNQATGDNSVAIGYNANASYSNSVSIGSQTVASGYNSVAFGANSTASNSFSMAMGYKTTASGYLSFAAGNETTASDYYTIAMGYKSIASKYGATAIGYEANATGNTSFSLGYRTKTKGTNSAAINSNTMASGFSSTAMGSYTHAKPYTSLAIGMYNDTTCSVGGENLPQSTDPVFIIGNGTTSSNLSNAFTVLRNGNTAIGHETPSEMLDVDGNARFRGITSGTSAGALHYTSDGTLTTSSSDIRLKENIETLNNSLQKVLKLRGVSFSWKKDLALGRRIGFIAQEVEKVIPELVFVNPNDGYKGINYEEISAVLVEAIKEQQQIINDQAIKNKELENQILEINKKLEEIIKDTKK